MHRKGVNNFNEVLLPVTLFPLFLVHERYRTITQNAHKARGSGQIHA
jgi:hypothetical protein